jgi:hypothetical protein
MATTLNPIAPDALLKIVEQVKEYYVEPSPQRRRGCPHTFSSQAFLLLAVVGVVLRTFKCRVSRHREHKSLMTSRTP